MIQQVVLSLFPGADLFGRAFEAEGFCVVRGPDTLWGGDVRDFHAPPGRFDGVIGGPPCQVFSTTAFTGTPAENLIPEFLRVVNEAAPQWVVMENIPNAVEFAPDWPYTVIEDFDCGGHTSRKRGFWVYGIPMVPAPPHREGDRAYSVLASSWKLRGSDRNGQGVKRFSGHDYLRAHEAARLQGFPGLDKQIKDMLPSRGGKSGLSNSARDIFAVHLLGNGVPAAMGRWVAQHVRRCIKGEYDVTVGLPLFAAPGAR